MEATAAALEPGLERQIAMLDELAEMGLDLARSVKALAQKQVADALDGWTHRMPSDPGAAFARLAQSVRRTIALSVHLHGVGEGSALFSRSSGLDVRLHPDELPTPFAVPREPADAEPSVTPAQALSGDGLSPACALRADLGSLLDPRERLLETPRGNAHSMAGDLCLAFGLDPQRLKHDGGGWIVRADPNDPQSRDLPFRDWRPDPEAFLDPPAPEPRSKPPGDGTGPDGHPPLAMAGRRDSPVSRAAGPGGTSTCGSRDARPRGPP